MLNAIRKRVKSLQSKPTDEGPYTVTVERYLGDAAFLLSRIDELEAALTWIDNFCDMKHQAVRAIKEKARRALEGSEK